MPDTGPWELFQTQSQGPSEHGPWEMFEPAPKKEPGLGEKLFAGARGFADTAMFGMNERAQAALAAALGAARGEGFDYAGNLARQRGITQYEREQAPLPFLAGQLTGGLTFPAGAAARGASIIERLARGAVAGAGQGGLYAAGSSPDLLNLPEVLKDAATGATVGGAIGGIAAPVGTALAGGLARAASTLRGITTPSQEAARRVAGALAEDARLGKAPLGFGEDALEQARALGQPAVIGDLGAETTGALARSAANISPAARQILEDVVQPRFEEQSGRISELLGTLGAGNTTQTLDRLQIAARAANRPLYEKAFAEGEKGIWNEGLANLIDAPVVQDAVKAATRTGANRAVAEGFRPVKAPFEIGETGMLTPRVNPDGTRAVPTLQFWDGVKRNLDDKIGSLLRSGEKSAASDAMALRSQLIGYMDRASPSYAKARGTAAQFFGAQDAMEAGTKFVAAKGSNDSFRPALAKMSGPERNLFAHGFASELANTALKTPDSSDVVRKIAKSQQAKERIEMALGPERAQKLMGFLAVESAMTSLKRAVQANSTTARQLSELGLAGGAAGIDYLTGGHGALTAGTLGLMALRHGAKAGVNVANRGVAEQVGRLLASDSPQAMKELSALAAKSERVRNVLLSITPKAVSAIVPQAVGAAVQ